MLGQRRISTPMMGLATSSSSSSSSSTSFYSSSSSSLSFSRAFILSVFITSLWLISTVSAADEHHNAADSASSTTPLPNSAGETTTVDMEKLRNTKSDFIFPLVCGLAGIPIFGIVIAAAVYQPFYSKKRAVKKRREVELERKKRADSATEKFRALQAQISISPSQKDKKEREAFLDKV